jgi:peroxiredoxin
MTLKIGDAAPGFLVQLPGEQTVSLAAFRGKPLILILLRHLA